MEKITKVQEVSSFVMNFDNKKWNEIVLQLTIIGIRYVTNHYQDSFKWTMEDLLKISEQLISQKVKTANDLKEINDNNQNNKSNNDTSMSNSSTNKDFLNDKNNIYHLNYNYKSSNTRLFKIKSNEKYNNKKEKKSNSMNKNSSINNDGNNNKKYYINKISDNNYNNSMLLLTDRRSYCNSMKDSNNFNYLNNSKLLKENEKKLNYYEDKRDQNKKKNNRNKILSLNKNISNQNNYMDLATKVNDYSQNYRNKIIKNNYMLYKNISNQIRNNEEKMSSISNTKNINKENQHKFSNSCIINKTFSLHAGIEKKQKYVYLNENKRQRDNKNIEFISELRKMSHSNEKRKKEINNRRKNNILNQSQSISVKPSFRFDENRKKSNLIFQNVLNNNNNLSQDNKIQINYDKDNDSIINLNDKTNYEDVPKTVNRNYDNKLNNISSDISDINYTYNFIDNKQIDQKSLNKYLKNPNYKNKKLKNSSEDDIDINNNVNNKRAYIYLQNDENDKNNNNIIEGKDRYSCHYFYESKKQPDVDMLMNDNGSINDFKGIKSDKYENNNIKNDEIDKLNM